MRTNLKNIAAAFAAVVAVGLMSAPASAEQQNQQPRFGLFNALVSPFGAAAIAGPVTNTFHWTTTKSMWVKVPVKKTTTAARGFNFVKKPKYKWVKVEKTKHHSKSSKNINGKVIVGCIFGSAVGAITASIRKGNAMGNPLRWRSQAEHEAIVRSGYEKQFELTNDEAHTAVAFCGLGSLALRWDAKPAVVTTKY